MTEPVYNIQRVEHFGKRHYQVEKILEDNVKELMGIFPSVTSVLSETKDKTWLKNWENRIGKKEAKKISTDSTDRGTVMHRLCELYLNMPPEIKPHDRLQEVLELARTDDEINQFDTRAYIVGGQLFYNFYMSNFFERIQQVISQEEFLWSTVKGGYAGTVDNFSVMDDGQHKIIDFKTSKKPKKEEWIEGYKIQVAAYGVAMWERKGIKPDGAEIWISAESERFPQCFMMSWDEMTEYFKIFLQRLDAFREIYPIVTS